MCAPHVGNCTSIRKQKSTLKKKSTQLSKLMSKNLKEPDLKESERKAVDARFNYACTSLGMLLFNFDDAVKEGDSERLLRCWKFMMLIFKAI